MSCAGKHRAPARGGRFRQFRRWADSGVWDVILEGLAGSGVSDAALQMIDATIIRAHHCAAGGKRMARPVGKWFLRLA